MQEVIFQGRFDNTPYYRKATKTVCSLWYLMNHIRYIHMEVFALDHIFTQRGNFKGFWNLRMEPQDNKLINTSDIQQTKSNSQKHNPSSEAKDRMATQEILVLYAPNFELPCLHDSRTRQNCSSRVLPFSSPSLSTVVKYIQLHIMDEKKFVWNIETHFVIRFF